MASASILISGRPWVNSANDTFNGLPPIPRYNRSRFVRLTNWCQPWIQFLGQGEPGGEGFIGVLVDNVSVATVAIANSTAIPAWYTVNNLFSSGCHTVDLYEGFQTRTTNLNQGVDGSALGTYVAAVQMAAGASATPVTAPNCIAAFGDSHMDGLSNSPESVNGWAGQLRQAALKNGSWILGYVGAGSSTLAGDGPTADQTAQMVHDLFVDMGCSGSKHFLMMRRPNDYAYWGIAPSPVNSTPAQYGTYLQVIQTDLDASDPGWTGIYTRIPQGTSWGANGGGYTLADYFTATAAAATAGGRVNVQTFDGSVDVTGYFGLKLATDFSEAAPGQVHMIQVGHNEVYTSRACGWFGLC